MIRTRPHRATEGIENQDCPLHVGQTNGLRREARDAVAASTGEPQCGHLATLAPNG
jgi:hypothetical protein